MILYLCIAVVFLLIMMIKQSSEIEILQTNLKRLAWKNGLEQAEGVFTPYYTERYPGSAPVKEEAHQQLEMQFATLVDSLGYEFQPETQEEVHEVKVTPAQFVPKKKRRR